MPGLQGDLVKKFINSTIPQTRTDWANATMTPNSQLSMHPMTFTNQKKRHTPVDNSIRQRPEVQTSVMNSFDATMTKKSQQMIVN
jgi:hypothetical protein